MDGVPKRGPNVASGTAIAGAAVTGSLERVEQTCDEE